MQPPTPPTPPRPSNLPPPPQPVMPPPMAAPQTAPLGEPADAPLPPELLPQLSFWQQPWVQNVLPLVTSLTIHAAIIVVGVVLALGAKVYQTMKPLEEQIIVPDAAIVEEGPAGGVQNVGIGGDPTRPPAQDEYAEGGEGWAPKPGDKDATAALMGGGDGDSSDAVIGLSAAGGGFGKGAGVGSGAGDGRGSGTGDGRGALAPFGTPGGGGIGLKSSFVGVRGNARTVVFVCDASGSMINTFGSLKAELVKAISRLKSVQGFNIVFFQDEKCTALDQNLLFATPDNKRKAFKWLEEQTTTGTTNPIPGIELAFKNKPQLIYLLTDADFPDNNAVRDAIKRMNTSKQTRVNTIIFVGDGDDDVTGTFVELMKEVAKDNGGVYARVKESDLQ
jgi:hypothetical protein